MVIPGTGRIMKGGSSGFVFTMTSSAFFINGAGTFDAGQSCIGYSDGTATDSGGSISAEPRTGAHLAILYSKGSTVVAEFDNAPAAADVQATSPGITINGTTYAWTSTSFDSSTNKYRMQASAVAFALSTSYLISFGVPQ